MFFYKTKRKQLLMVVVLVGPCLLLRWTWIFRILINRFLEHALIHDLLFWIYPLPSIFNLTRGDVQNMHPPCYCATFIEVLRDEAKQYQHRHVDKRRNFSCIDNIVHNQQQKPFFMWNDDDLLLIKRKYVHISIYNWIEHPTKQTNNRFCYRYGAITYKILLWIRRDYLRDRTESKSNGKSHINTNDVEWTTPFLWIRGDKTLFPPLDSIGSWSRSYLVYMD